MGKLQVFNPLVQHGFVKPRCLHTDYQDFRWCFDGDGDEDDAGAGDEAANTSGQGTATAAASAEESQESWSEAVGDAVATDESGYGGSWDASQFSDLNTTQMEDLYDIADGGLGYNDLTEMGYHDKLDQEIAVSDKKQAEDLTGSLQDKGYDVTVSPDPEVGFSYQGPDAFSAAAHQIGTDAGKGIQAGIDMGLGLASATPSGMAIGALSDKTSPGYGMTSGLIGEYEPVFQGVTDNIKGLMSDAPVAQTSMTEEVTVAPDMDYSLSAFGDLEGPNVDLSTDPNFADTVAANAYDTSYNAPYADTISVEDLGTLHDAATANQYATDVLGLVDPEAQAYRDAAATRQQHAQETGGRVDPIEESYRQSYRDNQAPDPFNNYADAVAEADAAMFGGGYGPPVESYPMGNNDGDGNVAVIIPPAIPEPDPDPDPVPPRPPYVPPVHTPVRFASMGLLAPTQLYGSPERQAMIRQYMADYPTLDRVFTRG